jgi:hypothetical protein
MSGAAQWQEISGETRLNDGAQVLVRQGPEGAQRALVFRAGPAPRWESPNGFHVWDFRYFTQWRGMAERDGRSTAESRRQFTGSSRVLRPPQEPIDVPL